MTTSLAIHSNLPVPEKKTGGRAAPDFPFGALDIGQAFFVPIPEGKKAETVKSRVRQRASIWKAKNDKRAVEFRIADAPDPTTQAPSIGVWRVA